MSQPSCNRNICVPSHGPSCNDCNSTSSKCSQAWNNQPGSSCGTAVGKSTTGKVLYEAMCCPQVYSGAKYHCQPEAYSVLASGVTYQVEGFSCARESSGLGAIALVGITTGVLVLCVAALLVGCRFYRRRMLQNHTDALLAPSLMEERSEGSYSPPLLHSQPPQPYSTQPYNLSMQPPQYSTT